VLRSVWEMLKYSYREAIKSGRGAKVRQAGAANLVFLPLLPAISGHRLLFELLHVPLPHIIRSGRRTGEAVEAENIRVNTHIQLFLTSSAFAFYNM
jgi:hypothetical protein